MKLQAPPTRIGDIKTIHTHALKFIPHIRPSGIDDECRDEIFFRDYFFMVFILSELHDSYLALVSHSANGIGIVLQCKNVNCFYCKLQTFMTHILSSWTRVGKFLVSRIFEKFSKSINEKNLKTQ